jgi:hypothetical protein
MSRTFTPAAQRELAGAVGRLVQDADAAAEARHVHDRSAAALEHRGQQRERQAHRRVQVHVHHPLDLGRVKACRVRHARRRRVVDHDVDAAQRGGRVNRQPVDRLAVRQIDDKTLRIGRVHAALGEDGVESLAAARREADRDAPFRQLPGQGGTDAR